MTSRIFSHVQTPVDKDTFLFATLDWENVPADPELAYFDAMFSQQLNPETLQLYDVEEAFHPFTFAAKVQAKDFPAYHDILRMSGKERLKWIESMDAEMQDLTDCNAYKLVKRHEATSRGKQVIKSMWAFRRK